MGKSFFLVLSWKCHAMNIHTRVCLQNTLSRRSGLSVENFHQKEIIFINLGLDFVVSFWTRIRVFFSFNVLTVPVFALSCASL
jgi:hypothetical protein